MEEIIYGFGIFFALEVFHLEQMPVKTNLALRMRENHLEVATPLELGF